MKAGLYLTLATACLMSACSIIPSKTLVIEDNFDSGNIAKYWRAEKPFGYSITVVPSPQKKGESVRFEWRKNEWDNNRHTKGTELKTFSFEEMPSQELEMSVFFDASLIPEGRKPVIIMQYHSIPDIGDGEQWRKPVTSLIYQNGELTYSYRSSRGKVTPGHKGKWKYDSEGEIRLGKPKLDAWNHIKLRQDFDITGENGHIEISLNDQTFTAEDISLGYNDRKGPYLKFGLYCPQSSDHETLAILFDDIRLHIR